MIPAQFEAALLRMETDIKIIRENFDSNPWLAMAGFADLEVATKYLGAGYEVEKDKRAREVKKPELKDIMSYIQTQYVAAGVDLSFWGPLDFS